MLALRDTYEDYSNIRNKPILNSPVNIDLVSSPPRRSNYREKLKQMHSPEIRKKDLSLN